MWELIVTNDLTSNEKHIRDNLTHMVSSFTDSDIVIKSLAVFRLDYKNKFGVFISSTSERVDVDKVMSKVDKFKPDLSIQYAVVNLMTYEPILSSDVKDVVVIVCTLSKYLHDLVTNHEQYMKLLKEQVL